MYILKSVPIILCSLESKQDSDPNTTENHEVIQKHIIKNIF